MTLTEHLSVGFLVDVIRLQAKLSNNPTLKIRDIAKNRTDYHVQTSPDPKDDQTGGVKVSRAEESISFPTSLTDMDSQRKHDEIK